MPSLANRPGMISSLHASYWFNRPLISFRFVYHRRLTAFDHRVNLECSFRSHVDATSYPMLLSHGERFMPCPLLDRKIDVLSIVPSRPTHLPESPAGEGTGQRARHVKSEARLSESLLVLDTFRVQLLSDVVISSILCPIGTEWLDIVPASTLRPLY